MTNYNSRVKILYMPFCILFLRKDKFYYFKNFLNSESWSDLRLHVTVKTSITQNTLFLIFSRIITLFKCIKKVWWYLSSQGGGWFLQPDPSRWFRTWFRVSLGLRGAVTKSGLSYHLKWSIWAFIMLHKICMSKLK